MPLAWHPVCSLPSTVGELGTFRLRSGEFVRCRFDRSGRLLAYREVGDRLVPCDPRQLLDAVKLSDDPEWLADERLSFGAISGD